MKMQKWILFLGLVCLGFVATAQSNEKDSLFIHRLHAAGLSDGKSYAWLQHLCLQIGHRLSGSTQAARAVDYTRQELESLGLDRVWLQPCMVPYWVRGDKEVVYMKSPTSHREIPLTALALGNSVGTGPDGIRAEVIEVQGVEALEKMDSAEVKGKIIFFNKPMDPTKLNTFEAYGGAVGQRYRGPALAADKGAVAAIVRSVTTSLDDYPHTGVTMYREDGPNIPAVAISTLAANALSETLKKERMNLYVRTTCQMLPPVESHNVIGEIRGYEKPNEIILVGGHLDSWDVGHGAHDDGAGCVQAMEVLYLLKKVGYQPKRTIRCVLFMNEENGGAGAEAYAQASKESGELPLLSIESDAGGFTPRGFSFDGEEVKFDPMFAKVRQWSGLLDDYYLGIWKGGSGADIAPLKDQGGLLSGYRPDSQRYFDFHHAATDVFEAVNQRELELGAIAMASLVYLVDRWGL